MRIGLQDDLGMRLVAVCLEGHIGSLAFSGSRVGAEFRARRMRQGRFRTALGLGASLFRIPIRRNEPMVTVFASVGPVSESGLEMVP